MEGNHTQNLQRDAQEVKVVTGERDKMDFAFECQTMITIKKFKALTELGSLEATF